MAEQTSPEAFVVTPLEALANERLRAADEQRVVDEQQLRVEDRRQLPALQLGDPVADLPELLARRRAGPFERRQLPVHAPRRDGKPDHLRALNRDERGPDDEAARHADALQTFHDSPGRSAVDGASNPDSTSRTSASTARSSSAPSASTPPTRVSTSTEPKSSRAPRSR